jgi:hypothetical protein
VGSIFPQVIVVQAADHSWLEIIFWISQIILMIIAAAAAVFAYSHVQEAKDSVKRMRERVIEAEETRKQELKISHANLIMSLDARWDSPQLSRARAMFTKLREEINTKVSNENPIMSDDQKKLLAKREWTDKMANLRASDNASYMRLLNMCAFFETVGLLVKGNYIEKDDIFGLFFGSIVMIDHCFREHMEDRAIEMGVPKGFFEHALYLCDLAKAP